MNEGGAIENSRVPGFDRCAPIHQLLLTEFFTMVSAGLAAPKSHMISATHTAISLLNIRI